MPLDRAEWHGACIQRGPNGPCPPNAATASLNANFSDVRLIRQVPRDGSRDAVADQHKQVEPGATADRQWVALEEAGRILGISATTLRRWSDAGIIETFVTPGGHRRFSLQAVRALLPGTTVRPTMEQLGETPERIARVYRRAAIGKALAGVGGLDEAQRLAFREHGRIMATEVLAALDASTDTDREAHLQAASEAAAEHGVAAAIGGVPVSATVETFLRFRRPFVDELITVARRRGLGTTEATGLLRSAADAFDQLLVATVRAHEATVGEAASAGRRAVPTLPPQLSRDQEVSLR